MLENNSLKRNCWSRQHELINGKLSWPFCRGDASRHICGRLFWPGKKRYLELKMKLEAEKMFYVARRQFLKKVEAMKRFSIKLGNAIYETKCSWNETIDKRLKVSSCPSLWGDVGGAFVASFFNVERKEKQYWGYTTAN